MLVCRNPVSDFWKSRKLITKVNGWNYKFFLFDGRESVFYGRNSLISYRRQNSRFAYLAFRGIFLPSQNFTVWRTWNWMEALVLVHGWRIRKADVNPFFMEAVLLVHGWRAVNREKYWRMAASIKIGLLVLHSSTNTLKAKLTDVNPFFMEA